MDNLSFAVGVTVGIGVTLMIAGFHRDWDHISGEKKRPEFKILKDQDEIDQELLDGSIRGDQKTK